MRLSVLGIARPNKHCNGEVVPILDPVDKVNSAFNQILRKGWFGMPQMPKTGPFVTDKNYSVTLNVIAMGLLLSLTEPS